MRGEPEDWSQVVQDVRAGDRVALVKLTRLISGRANGSREDELALIGEIGQVMRDASICGLGQLAANAVDSAVHRLKLFDGAAS